MNLTLEQKTLTETEGACTKCGVFVKAGYRNTAGECTDCHNKGYYEWKVKRAGQIAEAKEIGRKYWLERGINIGDRLVTYVPDMLGIQVTKVHGIAKTGSNGAYVSSTFQQGKLSPVG